MIIGGILEGILGLFARYWLKFISPVVAASVVTAIRISLLPVGASSFAGGTGAAVMLAAGLFPPVAALLATMPESVLGGCTIIMFGQIVISGIDMIKHCGFTERNTIIISLSLAAGLGFTGVQGIFRTLPEIWADSLQNNCVAIVFLISLIMDILLPKEEKKVLL
ncbi:MAG: hypothetical protein J5706_03690 [Elusimicrobiales bacterium]|nr:hypothetical protein [Elusimicrobiales bacterium]